MRNFTKSLVTGMGLTALTVVAALGENPSATPSHSSGNQLMANSTHWYEKAADTVGPVTEITAKGSTLLVLQPGSVLYMEGDSTLHKYQMRAGALTGSAVLKVPTGKNLLEALKAHGTGPMALGVVVDKFKSRESGLDDNAYKALKSKDFPEIRFALKTAIFDSKTSTLKAKGTLTVAGAEAPITLTSEAKAENGQIRLKGLQKIKMSDFKVTPPSISLLVTSITCSDDIEIHYDVIFAEVKK